MTLLTVLINHIIGIQSHIIVFLAFLIWMPFSIVGVLNRLGVTK